MMDPVETVWKPSCAMYKPTRYGDDRPMEDRDVARVHYEKLVKRNRMLGCAAAVLLLAVVALAVYVVLQQDKRQGPGDATTGSGVPVDSNNESSSDIYAIFNQTLIATIGDLATSVNGTIDTKINEMRLFVNSTLTKMQATTSAAINQAVTSTLSIAEAKISNATTDAKLAVTGALFGFDIGLLLNRQRQLGQEGLSEFQNKLVGGVPMTARVSVWSLMDSMLTVEFGCTAKLRGLVRWPLRRDIGVKILKQDNDVYVQRLFPAQQAGSCLDPSKMPAGLINKLLLDVETLRSANALANDQLRFRLEILP